MLGLQLSQMTVEIYLIALEGELCFQLEIPKAVALLLVEGQWIQMHEQNT